MLPSLPVMKCVNSKSINFLLTNSLSFNNTQFVEFSLHNNTDDFIELQNIRQIKLIQSIKTHIEEAKHLNSRLLKIQKNFVVVGNNMNLLCCNQRKLYQQWFKVTK
ncbi:Hypothetical_protein [Hexamita inflata]|uniref:Hypothetical_protein n=1 Tax=Hexamita inflata TaxID=28002 RepID=A0AA86Q987_9EUKA|nr:Hypothetical protein HINF_LOCUS42276 [Hexamita inflata]